MDLADEEPAEEEEEEHLSPLRVPVLVELFKWRCCCPLRLVFEWSEEPGWPFNALNGEGVEEAEPDDDEFEVDDEKLRWSCCRSSALDGLGAAWWCIFLSSASFFFALAFEDSCSWWLLAVVLSNSITLVLLLVSVRGTRFDADVKDDDEEDDDSDLECDLGWH